MRFVQLLGLWERQMEKVFKWQGQTANFEIGKIIGMMEKVFKWQGQTARNWKR